jgi:hypothetical protein
MTTATAPLQTRTSSTEGFKRTDIGFGWGRICVDCGGGINHLHAGDYCYRCEERREAEGLEATA